MTARDLLAAGASHPSWLIPLFCTPPVIALLLRWIHGRGQGGERPYRTFYAVLVYAVCIPGMLGAVLVGYTLFFTRENLLDVDVLVYGLPLGSMVITLLIIARSVGFDEIPGFGRLSGLMVMIGMTFVIILALQKTRIWLVFGGSIGALLVIAAAIFALLKWGAYMAFRRREEPERDPPRFDNL